MFIESHPENHFTANFPLQPFIDNGTNLSYDDPRRWIYTTIGDMAKDTRALGYMYGMPVSPDVYRPPSIVERRVRNLRPSGGRAIYIPKGAGISGGCDNATSTTNGVKTSSAEAVVKVPFVVFTDVGCTASSYRIDVFAPKAQSMTPDVLENPDFIGQITRVGMGPGRAGVGLRNSGRCRKPAASRVLNAERFADQLAAEERVQVVVTDLQDGKQLTEEDYKKLPGFEPKIMWLPGA
jgi:tyrosinase